MTRWGRLISPDKPVLPEYPRPQMVRQSWLNLNGLWDYAITAKDAPAPAAYSGKILVPFPIESVLSQVNKRLDENSRLWYRRRVQIPAAWSGQHILLHFGAVDWETTVQVNGKLLGTHRGGYDGFTFDITDALRPTGPQELIVSVWDPTMAGQPSGKQERHPSGIFYTPTSGIWQTVWLEPVAESHIEKLQMIPDVDAGQLKLTVKASGAAADQTVEAIVSDAGREIARTVAAPGQLVKIPIPHARLWWPDSPFLYDIRVTLRHNGQSLDTVSGYFGMRKISVGRAADGLVRILLNNQFVLHNGVLDQGFWPDGIYTAPSDEALRYDIEMTKKLGFNMTRKHIKVEPERWYYWADKLGLLVWQDMPSSRCLAEKNPKGTIPDMVGQFERELRQMIAQHANHPSIVMWILFNEGWGLEMERYGSTTPSKASQAVLHRMVDAARQEDRTRLINHDSGASGGGWQGMNPWDIVDFHCYGKSNGPEQETHRASVIGEYGWGLSPTSPLRLLSEVKTRGVSGLVLTQLTDVENERNGALTYDRVLKHDISAEKTAAALREQFGQWYGPGAARPHGAKKTN